jgi:hypothetical protein
MDNRSQLNRSPDRASERKDSGSFLSFTFPKRLDTPDDCLALVPDCWEDEAEEEMHSIFNIGYSPLPLIGGGVSHGSPQKPKMAFPAFDALYNNGSTVSTSPGGGPPPLTLCEMFGVNQRPTRLSGNFNEEEASRADDLEPIPLPLSPNLPTDAVVVKEYLSRIMKHSYLESQKFREFENNIKSKGLKLLSIIVFEIVTLKVNTTYKEVADLILKDTIHEPEKRTDRKNELSREEQNIKRRVYDVLNVLISANTFLKDGKVVRRNDVDPEIIAKNKRAELNSLYSKLVGLSEEQKAGNRKEVGGPGIR